MAETPKKIEALSVRKAVFREAGGFAAAEMMSMAVSMGVVTVMDRFIPKEIMHKVDSTVAKVCVLPFLDGIEKCKTFVCRLEECKVDVTQPREKRAEAIAHWLVLGGVAWALSMEAKVLTRRFANNKLHIKEPPPVPLGPDASIMDKIMHRVTFQKWTKQERMIVATDELAHLGALVFLNTKGAKFTDAHIRSTTKILEKQGIEHDKAKEMATWIWVWESSNMVGMAAGMGAVFTKHAYNWPLEHKHQSFADIVSGKAKSLIVEPGRS